MSKLLMVVILAGFGAMLQADAGQQNAGPRAGQKPAPEKDTMKPVTVAGCVAQSGAVYRLDHAIVGIDTDVDTQNRPATEASPIPKMIAYTLTGADVKAHLGHKIEVTGTISTDTKSNAATDIKGAPGMKLVGTLNVKSVKMVANTCP